MSDPLILEKENESKKVTVASGILLKEGKILLIKRSPKHKLLPNTWQLPEGKLDKGETPEQALVREIKEEIGLDVLESNFYKKFYVKVPYLESVYDVDRLVYLVKVENGEIILSKEHTEYKWFDIDKAISNVDNYIGIIEILEELNLNKDMVQPKI